MDQIVSFDGAGQTTQSATPATATIGFAAPVGVSGEAFTVDHLSQGFYGSYLIDSHYANRTGLDVLPIGQVDGVNVVTKTQNATTEKVVFWTCERVNAHPLLPALLTSDPNEIPIVQEILFANCLQMLNNQTVWKVSGVNKYKLLQAKNSSSTYPIGTTPAEVAPASTRFYGPLDFSTAIIDASAGIPAGVSEGLTLQKVIQQRLP